MPVVIARPAIARLAVAAAVPALALAAAPAHAQVLSLSQSSAFSISATFNHVGDTTDLGPLTQVQGSAPPNYHMGATLMTFHRVLPLDASASAPTLTVTARGLQAHVVSRGLGLNIITDQASTGIKSADLELADAGKPVLQITATDLKSVATHTLMVINEQQERGTASIGSLSISGPLVGGKTLTFAGDAPPNTVLYDSATVTVTVGRHVEKSILPIGCPIVCALLRYDINEQVLNVTLHKARIGDGEYGGSIVLGESFAGPASLPLSLQDELAND